MSELENKLRRFSVQQDDSRPIPGPDVSSRFPGEFVDNDALTDPAPDLGFDPTKPLPMPPNIYGGKDPTVPPPPKVEVESDDQHLPENNLPNRSPRYVKTLANKSSHRLDVPSQGFAYDSLVEVRHLGIYELARLSKALSRRSLTLMIDAFAPTVNVDIRDLTIGDWTFFRYWQKLSSFTKTPYNITWTSRYGNEQVTRVTQSMLEVVYADFGTDASPDEVRQEYLRWNVKGFAYPTLRDFEAFEDLQDVDEEQQYLYNCAQYLVGNTFQEKLTRLEEDGSAALLEDIVEFKNKFMHGVKESVKLTDASFDPKAWLERLSNNVNILRKSLDPSPETDLDILEMEAEVQSLRERLEAGENIVAEPEVVRLRLQPFDFFPDL